jgi:hypothetical protein
MPICLAGLCLAGARAKPGTGGNSCKEAGSDVRQIESMLEMIYFIKDIVIKDFLSKFSHK